MEKFTALIRHANFYFNRSYIDKLMHHNQLDAALRPLSYGKNKYRTNVLFRYRDYNDVPGVEYMSFGLKLPPSADFIAALTTIQEIAYKLLCKYNK